MRQTLLHGLFPQVRAEILRLLFTNPRTELYVRQLARLTDLSLQTIQDELAKLEAARLIVSRSNGYHRFYRAESKHPLYATLRKLVVRASSRAKPQPKARGQAKHEPVEARVNDRTAVANPRRSLSSAAIHC
jgi:DNA-binding transcriptional ArsR family regulator